MLTCARLRVLGLVAALLPAAALAGAGHAPHVTAPADTPAPAEIPGLSAGEITDLIEGRGMGLARVADELGYPGPRHVLDAWAAGQLALTPAQAARMEEIFATTTREARRLGALVLAEERELAAALQAGTADAETVEARVRQIATLRGALRATHLRAHLETRPELDPTQIVRYTELRGQARPPGEPGHRH